MSTFESRGGVSYSLILFLIFLAFKLAGLVAWSWWWVTSPLWIGLIVWAVILSILGSMSDPPPRRFDDDEVEREWQ